jgi:hypothetical protein
MEAHNKGTSHRREAEQHDNAETELDKLQGILIVVTAEFVVMLIGSDQCVVK